MILFVKIWKKLTHFWQIMENKICELAAKNECNQTLCGHVTEHEGCVACDSDCDVTGNLVEVKCIKVKK